MISARNKLFHIVLGLILSWGSSSLLMAAEASERPREYKTVRYSTTVKKMLRQVVDKQAGLFNYQECSLIETNQEASYDGFEIESCKLLSNKWIIYDDPHLFRFNSVFASIFNEGIEAENESRLDRGVNKEGLKVAMAGLGVLVTAAVTLIAPRRRFVTSLRSRIVVGLPIFSIGSVLGLIGVVMMGDPSAENNLPSIESSLISQKDVIEQHLDGEKLTEEKIQDYSETYYFLFQNSLYETLMQVGLYPSA